MGLPRRALGPPLRTAWNPLGPRDREADAQYAFAAYTTCFVASPQTTHAPSKGSG